MWLKCDSRGHLCVVARQRSLNGTKWPKQCNLSYALYATSLISLKSQMHTSNMVPSLPDFPCLHLHSISFHHFLMCYCFHPATENPTVWGSLCRQKGSGAVNWGKSVKNQVPNLKDSPLNPEGVQGLVWTLGDSRAAASERHQKRLTLIIMSAALLEERSRWQESLWHTEAKGRRRWSLYLPDYGKRVTVDVLFVSFSRNRRENLRAIVAFRQWCNNQYVLFFKCQKALLRALTWHPTLLILQLHHKTIKKKQRTN